MKPLILWLLLATPKQDCIDKIVHENLGLCHSEAEMKKTLCNGGGMVHECDIPTGKNIMICDQVASPRPLPEEKTMISTDRNALKSDDCYEVRKASITVSEDKTDSSIFRDYVVISTISF